MTMPTREWGAEPSAPLTSGATERTGLRDQLSIATPELVAMEFPLAGIGSRFVALLLDYLLLTGAALVLILIFVLLIGSGAAQKAVPAGTRASLGYKFGVAVGIALPFVFQWCYFTLFEAFWHGQTPGKRAMKLRVIQQTGRPISLFESMARNFLRVIDSFPGAYVGLYVVGVISLFCTKRQQRLGDLVAGTLVVHERVLEEISTAAPSRTITSAVFETAPVSAPRISRLPVDAVARLTLADLHALESYLARRLDVPMATRELLATRLADSIARKMQFAVPVEMNREAFLEEAAFAARGATLARG